MANSLYESARAAILNQDTGFDFVSDTWKVSLIDTGTYTVNLATHDFHNDLSGIVATATLASKAITTVQTDRRAFDSADVTFSAVSGSTAEAFVLWSDTAGASSADPLGMYFDTSTGLPVTPNGGDIGITVNGDGWFYV